MKQMKKRYPILAAIVLLLAGYFGWYENYENSSEQTTQISQSTPQDRKRGWR